MISNISKRIVKWLLDAGAISQNQEELFSYATYMLLFNMAPLFFVIVLGAMFGLVKEGIVMLIPFLTIRKFSGGFHLQSPKSCICLSVLLLSGSLWLAKSVVDNNWSVSFSILGCLAAIQIFCVSPIDSASRRLTEKEQQAFRIIARYILLFFVLLYLILGLLHLFFLAAFIGMGIVITGLLQVPCFFMHREH